MIDTLLAHLAPHLCCGCGEIGVLLCGSCKEDIVETPVLQCVVCTRPAQGFICQAHRTTIQAAACGGVRQGALERLIDLYKFEYAKAAAGPLADILLTHLPLLPCETIVVPIPTIAAHIRQRGYDHALLLARQVARRRGHRVLPLIARQTNTIQRDAPARLRERQARQAFRLARPLDPAPPYLVIDDVATSGASLRAAVQLLRDAGAETVYVAAVARQPLD